MLNVIVVILFEKDKLKGVKSQYHMHAHTFTFTIPIIKILKKTFERIKTLEHN